MLALPTDNSNGQAEGASIERPVHVPGISFNDFEAILEHIYYRQVSFPIKVFTLKSDSIADLHIYQLNRSPICGGFFRWLSVYRLTASQQPSASI